MEDKNIENKFGKKADAEIDIDDFSFDNSEEKVPFDREPIDRYRRSSSYYNKKEETPNKKKVKTIKMNLSILYVFLAILVVINSVLGYFFIKLNSSVSYLANQRAVYNVDLSDLDTSKSTFTGGAKGVQSTVCITASRYNDITTYDQFFESSDKSRGSGVVYEIDRLNGSAYFITNYHVVYDSDNNKLMGHYWIMFHDSFVPVKCTFVGGSSTYDIAVLKVVNNQEVKTTGAIAATFADSTDITLTESVYVVGNSMGMGIRVAEGIVSVEEQIFADTNTYHNFISHTAPTNGGNSGGGLWNTDGHLLGIVNAKFKDVRSSGTLIYGEVVHGMFYAIPSSITLGIVKNILRNYNGVDPSDLLMPNIGLVYGESYSETNTYYNYTTKGGQFLYDIAIIDDTTDFEVNDIIRKLTYSFEGKTIEVEVNRKSSIESHIFNWSAGTKVVFSIVRNGNDGNASNDIVIDDFEIIIPNSYIEIK